MASDRQWQQQQQQPSLCNFFVLNDLYGNNEGREEERIFHFMPRDTSTSQKINAAGLAQAIIGFTQNFSDHCTEVVTTDKKRQYYYNPEPHFYMVLSVNVPKKEHSTSLSSPAGGNAAVNASTGGPTSTPPREQCEYDHARVSDKVFESVLKQAYKAFKLFHGTFTELLEQSGLDRLKAVLNFFTNYFERLDLASCDVLTIFEGIKFLPIDKDTYLRVQSFAGSLEHELFTETGFSGIEVSTFFMYLDFLIWSSLNQSDTQVLYEHMIKKVIPDCMKNELLVTSSVPTLSGQFVAPLYGPEGDLNDLNHQFVGVGGGGAGVLGEDDDEVLSVRTVYLDSNHKQAANSSGQYHLKPHWLVIYRAKNMWVCLLINRVSKPQLTREFFRRVNDFIGPKLFVLSDDVVLSLERHKFNIPSNSAVNSSSNATSSTRQTVVQAGVGNVSGLVPLTSTHHLMTGSSNMHPQLICYIYFNRMNLATRATIADRQSRINPSHDIMLQLCDLQNELNSPPLQMNEGQHCQCEFVERLVQNSSGYWLYGRVSHQREVYMVISNKDRTLKEVYETVMTILESEFSSLFYAT